MSKGPYKPANEWYTYFVNEYKFHTQTWAEGKKINNNVVVKGVTEGGKDDLYGVITHIYELIYNYMDTENKFAMFYYDWYGPPSRGTKIDKKYNSVEVRMDRK